MSVKKRLEQYCEHRKLSIGGFCREARISNSYFSNVRGEMGIAIKGKIKEAFDDLNIDWLLTGEGEMLKAPATLTVYNPTAEESKAMSEGVDMSVVPAEIVEEIEAELKDKMAIPIISPEIANAPNTDIKKYIRDKGDELKRIYINDLTQGAKVAECVESTSMWPTYQPGDWVFVKFIDKNSIIDGKTYHFDLNTLPTMIRKVKIEGDKLRLIAKNPTYGDIVIDHSEVNNISKIIGMWRNHFGDQYDEIEAVRRMKDHQIDLLIEQLGDSMKEIGKAGTRQDKLIEIIEKKL